jgi:hypothetical protein
MNKNWLIALPLLGLAACVPTQTTSNNSGAVSPTPVVVTTLPEPEITLAEFDALKEGMTYDEVVAIVKSPGQVESEYNDPKYPQYSSKSYSWQGPAKGFMTSSGHVIFNGGRLTTKMQNGLS